MIDNELKSVVCRAMQASSVVAVDPVQTLWSGYGQIVRMRLAGSATASSVIVKHIAPPQVGVSNARGWSGEVSHARKLYSYEVESNWYRDWSPRCDQRCRIPKCYAVDSANDQCVIILEDLDASGFPLRCGRLRPSQFQACLRWLANFHATFLKDRPDGLWRTGTYWHLGTRPEEFAVMSPGPLKDAAERIDERLSACRFQSLVHGDAKVANFCFGETDDQVAAVDFQYVGGGCGMKDLAYFMGSCLSDHECQSQEEECLSVYFDALSQRVEPSLAQSVEHEWRELFPWAWADFHRFLCGWCATHPKLTGYSRRMVERVIRSD